MDGNYSEDLRSGGKLIVSPGGWSIRYYFPGPDLRYKGTFFSIQGNNIDKYIDAWKNNFAKYLKLKEILPQGGESSFPGEMGMTIRIGGYHNGVCLTSLHMNINNQERLDNVIADYRASQIKAEKIQTLLRSL